MKSNHLKLFGLRDLRLFLFVRGFTAGRIGTAAIDPESGQLNGPYCTDRMYRFQELCHQCVIRMEKESASLWTEAGTLLPELRNLPTAAEEERETIPAVSEVQRTASMTEAQAQRSAARAAAAAAAAQNRRQENTDQIAARRQAILQRLVEIRDRITTRERVCEEELGGIADALSSRFSAYACGVLLKPFPAEALPRVDFHSHLENYYTNHANLKENIDLALKEEGTNHVAA